MIYKIKNISNENITMNYGNDSLVISANTSIDLVSSPIAKTLTGMAVLSAKIKLGQISILNNTIEVDLETALDIVRRAYNLLTDFNRYNDNSLLAKEIEIAKIYIDNEQLNTIIISYLYKEIDGLDLYRKKRAELAFKISQNELSESEVLFIESKLKEVKDSLITGDWKTAKNTLSPINTEGAFTEEIKNSWLNEINEYIVANY
ncbi:MAG: hypothetical protein ACKOW9_03225 [Candidatus Paceibacterota bacterium]